MKEDYSPAPVPVYQWRPNNDEPTLEDWLSRDSFIHKVAEDIAICNPPQVFGIHGDWGSGKTSFLHQLCLHLIGHCPILDENAFSKEELKQYTEEAKEKFQHLTVVWFEAWRYQFEETPIVALLQEIRSQLRWEKKLWNHLKKETEIAVRSALVSFEDITKKIGIQASKIQELGEKWEKENLAVQLPSHMIKQHLEATLDKLLNTGTSTRNSKKRLVVIVDDLDRCEPEPAYSLLEGIKIYLNLKNCIFVLGMNQRIIEDAIAKRLMPFDISNFQKPNSAEEEAIYHKMWRAQLIRRQDAREYIEKLCQNIWHLPLIQNPGQLLRRWLPDDSMSDGILGKICELTETSCCLPSNPRKIKSFANVLMRFVQKWEGRRDGRLDSPDHEKLILIMACLYQFHQDIYRIIEVHPEFYEQVRKWCVGDPSCHAALCDLILTKEREKSEKSPTPSQALQETYPDPVHGPVFRIQGLINDLKVIDSSIINNYILR